MTMFDICHEYNQGVKYDILTKHLLSHTILFLFLLLKRDFLPPREALSVRGVHSETSAHVKREGFFY